MIDNKNRICSKPFRFIEIVPSGNAYPCSPVWTKDGGYSFGNIYEQGIDSIWNGDKARLFRRSVLEGNYEYCNFQRCTAYYDNTEHNENAQIFFERSEILEKYKETMEKYPEKVSLGHDWQCNAHCVICREQVISNTAEETEKLNSLINPVLLPLLKDAKLVFCNFNGELFASSHFRNLIKIICKTYPHIKFVLRTNGVLCDKKNCDELGITERLENVGVSLHAVTERTYKKIVRGIEFDKVLKNVEWLSSLKKKNKLNHLRLVMVVSSLNYKEIVPFIKLAEKHDADITLSQYAPNNPAMDGLYNKLAIWEKWHPHYNKFVKIIDTVKNKFSTNNDLFLGINFRTLSPVSKFEFLRYKFNKESK